MAGTKGHSGGHNRKSTREKELSGNLRKSRRNALEPVRVEAHPVQMRPKFNAAGMAIWDHYEPMLWNNGTLSAADALPLSMLCLRYQDWLTAWNRCRRFGRYCTDDLSLDPDRRGNQIEHKEAPWSKVEKQLWDQIIKLCRDFGLTPVSRSSVQKIVRGEAAKGIEAVT